MRTAHQPPESRSLLVRLRMLPDGTMRLAFDGELDVASGDHIAGVSLLVTSSAATSVDLDLGGLTFIDLHGLRSIEGLIRCQAERGVVVTECAAAACVERLRTLVARPTGWPGGASPRGTAQASALDAGVRNPESSPVMSSSTS